MMNKRFPLFLGLIVLVSSMLSFFMLTRGQTWPDDFAAYLMQAKSILVWQMSDFTHHNAFTIQNSSYSPGPVAYPWGFPLLLAPVIALFGISPLALKLVSVFFYALFLVAFTLLARTRLPDADALLLAGVLGAIPALLAANDLILSDIPFLAFSTLSLTLIDHLPRGKTLSALACGVAVFAAFFIRTSGILLLAPLLISPLVFHWPRWQIALRKAAVPVLTFALLTGLQFVVFPGGQESYFDHFSLFTPQRLLDNVTYYLWLPAWTFDHVPGGVIFYLITAFFALLSLFLRAWRDASLHIYGLLTLILFIVWPERQGLRFIYPILPVLFISSLDGMRLGIARLKSGWQPWALSAARGFWGLALLLCLSVSVTSAFTNMSNGRVINGPFDPISSEVFAYIREKTAADSIVIFVRPRALRLFTGRDSFMTGRCSDLVKGDYVVIHEKMADNGQISPDQVASCNPAVRLEKVYANKRFTVYKIGQ